MKTLSTRRRPFLPLLLPLAVQALYVSSPVRRHMTTTIMSLASNNNNTPTTPTTTTPPFQVYPASHYKELQQQTHQIHNNNNSNSNNKGRRSKVKLIHVVRHAEGTHNVEQNYQDLRHLDARLTEKGMDQCRALSQRIVSDTTTSTSTTTSTTTSSLPLPTCQEEITVVTSPLTRCVQTALYSFPQLTNNNNNNAAAAEQEHEHNNHVQFWAHEGIRETVNYSCDRRRTIPEIRHEFPRIHFQPPHCPQDADYIWDAYQDRLGPDWVTARESSELQVVVQRARTCFQWILHDLEQPQVVVCTHSAFLRCILNWGQSGGTGGGAEGAGVPRIMPQLLDEAFDPSTHIKLFEYCGDDEFEDYMRSDYDNCELRSFCLVQSSL
jgi:broad specificity phosphatase PhoE